MPDWYQFFISYCRADSEFALRLAKDLRQAKVAVWIEGLDWKTGEDAERILAESTGLIVILSPQALRSAQVQHELGVAYSNRRRVEAVLFQSCDYADLIHFHLPFDFRTDYVVGFRQLRECIGDLPWGSGGCGGVSDEEEEWALEGGAPPAGAGGSPEDLFQPPKRRPELPGEAAAKPTSAKKAARKAAKKKAMKRAEPPRVHIDYEPDAPESDEEYARKCTITKHEHVSAPETLTRDNVQFTVTGPRVLAPGEAHELLFWIHVEEQRATVLARAASELGLSSDAMSVKSEGPYPLERDSRLSVRLDIAGLNCIDNYKWITWTGDIGKTTFIVDVPADAAAKTYVGSASIRLNDCEIARMSFVVCVGSSQPRVEALPSETIAHRKAFASYASEDREAMLGRVQGMEAAWKGLDVFVDVMALRSGQNWESELTKHIADADVFYLFWCHHAKNSEWVSKEWRLALQAKGLDFIDPVPLESPQQAPPPPELASKHFNDPVLAFIGAAAAHF